MKTKANILNIGTKISCIIIFFFMAISSLSVNGQVKYNSANELSEAEMGVERVARYYLPAYSTKANNNNETRWVQIDLGQVKKIDGIKLLPGAQGWGPASGGFPARFKIEVSDVVDFRYSIMYEDYTLKKKLTKCQKKKKEKSMIAIDRDTYDAMRLFDVKEKQKKIEGKKCQNVLIAVIVEPPNTM